ncbi:hypothetical protein [Nesterenkonia populi]|uniref:variant leucine-rich repeat-containing protein n=1 Tax=Nesterenkonia populi TaxID=1591087 RepID=UPI0011BF9C86|nr:hypothetical protein [Nesterenkonia populi]
MTTPQDDAAELEALANHPDTDWEVLHWIAENYPELRPAVAANPGTYQELIDALASLGDPEIDSAIAMRGRRGVNSQRASTDPLAGMFETTTSLPAYTDDHYAAYSQYTPYPGAAEEQDTGDLPAGPFTEEPEDPAAEEAPTQEPQPAEEPAPVSWASEMQPRNGSAETAEPAGPAPVEEDEAAADYALAPAASQGARTIPPAPHQMNGGYTGSEQKERRSLVLPIAAAVGGVLALGMVVAVMVLLFVGDEEDPVAEPGAEEPAEPEEEDTPEEEGEQPPAEDEAQDEPEADELGEAQAALASLPEETSCEPGDDSGVLAALLSAGADEDGFPEDEHTSTLQEALSGLQDSCDAEHAGQTVGEARDAADAGALNEISYDWVDRGVGDRGAQTVSGFATPDGNIECDFSDGVTCTVYEHNYNDGCPGGEGTTYSMTVTGAEMDCDNLVEPDEGRESMPYDEIGTDGFIECASLEDRVSCYSALNPSIGFEISETGHYTYG